MAVTHAVMGRIAAWAEVDRGYYTWHTEEWLQILVSTNYEGRGDGRLWMYGPSESRESFMPERFDERVPGLTAYQNSQSLGTLEEGIVALRYIEREYGEDAVPDAVLLGLSTRLLGNIRGTNAPLLDALDKYAPNWKTDRTQHPPKLVPKAWWEGLAARLRFLGHQQRRYTAATFAVMRHALNAVKPGLGEKKTLTVPLSTSKYHHLAPVPLQETLDYLAEKDTLWDMIFAWRTAEDRGRLAQDFAAWREFVDRHGIELYVVNVPELSHVRERYAEGESEARMAAVRAELGDTPFLDLRTFLDDDLYYDSCHPTLEGSRRVSDRIAEFIAAERARRK
jgi:hypothetical protein